MGWLRSHQSTPFRYYLYISDSKLDMLFEQIGKSALKRISAEVKIDVKLASLTLRGAENPDPTRIAKLQVVEKYLEDRGKVGDIQNFGHGYFRGEMEMKWGLLPGGNAVLFRGTDLEGPRCIVLVGSSHHIRGDQRQTAAWPHSTLPSILEVLQSSKRKKPRDWQSVLLDSYSYVEDIPSQRLDFLAVQLAKGQALDYFQEFSSRQDFRQSTINRSTRASSRHGEDLRRIHVVLGTPLYIAMA